jgi:hypothetical protein
VKTIFKWLVEWFGQSFFYMIPVIAIILGGVLFMALLPEYGFWLTLGWALIVCVLYVRYSKWD